jgi:hypothetical protein
MSGYDDDIEFDFFDEPETQEATQRRRLPRLDRTMGPRREGPRPPRGPTSVVPLLRLVGLILLAIVIVVLLVFWISSCRGASKQSRYRTYLQHVADVGSSSTRIGRDLSARLTATGVKSAQLESSLDQLAQRQLQDIERARSLKPPGPLRLEQAQMVQALELRASGLSRLSAALRDTANEKDATTAAVKLAAQARFLIASDINWDVFFHDATSRVLKQQGVTDVIVPTSHILENPELASTSSLVRLWQNIHGAGGGNASRGPGPHGSRLVEVKAVSANSSVTLADGVAIKATPDLSFVATVEDSGASTEVNIPVRLTIGTGAKAIRKKQIIQIINAGEQQNVTFKGFQLPTSIFGSRTTIKVQVGLVPEEANTANNTATYSVLFSLP